MRRACFKSVLLTLLFALTTGLNAWASPPAQNDPIRSLEAPCGILENFIGDVQILDSSRTHLVNASLRAAIPCGSWVSVNQGWAQVRHKNGPHIHVAGQTFIQFPNTKTLDDHLVLYRGQIYVQAGGGEEEFRMLSASGRARVKRGKIIFLFSYQENETQLIALENSASLENRFEPTKRVKVQAGESTDLNFKLVRVVPTLPRAVSVASLRPRLAQLRVLENDQFDAIRAAVRRQSRKFAANLLETNSDEKGSQGKTGTDEGPTMGPSRKLASEGKKTNYLRHQPDAADPMLRAHLVKKMVGGEQLGERILFPDKFYGRSQSIRVEVEDPAEGMNQKQRAFEDAEKKRLIEELSQIRVE